jgi:hypothetical protein
MNSWYYALLLFNKFCVVWMVLMIFSVWGCLEVGVRISKYLDPKTVSHLPTDFSNPCTLPV